MENEIVLTRDLTKWPRLLVVGDPITEEQANEVIIRTSPWHWMSCNDKWWVRQVHELTGIELDDIGYPEFKSGQAFIAQVGALELEYLANHRIMSAYLGGPHGWCDWSGRIGCSDFNIGKWPRAEEVLDEWTSIAEAFPFLNLQAQLVPDEGASATAAVEFVVKDGTVTWRDQPTELLAAPDAFDPSVVTTLFDHGRERGVSIERLTAALEQVRSQRA